MGLHCGTVIRLHHVSVERLGIMAQKAEKMLPKIINE